MPLWIGRGNLNVNFMSRLNQLRIWFLCILRRLEIPFSGTETVLFLTYVSLNWLTITSSKERSLKPEIGLMLSRQPPNESTLGWAKRSRTCKGSGSGEELHSRRLRDLLVATSRCYNDAAWLSESFYCIISIIISLMEMWKTFTTVIVVYFLWSYQWTIMNSCVGLSILLSCEFSSRLVPNLLIKCRGVASFT